MLPVARRWVASPQTRNAKRAVRGTIAGSQILWLGGQKNYYSLRKGSVKNLLVTSLSSLRWDLGVKIPAIIYFEREIDPRTWAFMLQAFGSVWRLENGGTDRCSFENGSSTQCIRK